jgi:hypothetical protein
MKKVYYKSPVNNKVYSGNYDILSQDDALLYFDVQFFMTYQEAKKQPNYKL